MSSFTSVNNPQAEVTYINKRFMEDLLLAVQMVQFASKPDAQGRHAGDTVRWLQFPEWTVDVTAIDQTAAADNQVNISGTAGVVNVDKQMNPYGAYVEVSQFALDTMPVGTMDKIAKRAADGGAAALDTLAMVECSGTTSTYHAGTGSAALSGINFSDSGTVLKAEDLSYCAAILDDLGNTGFEHLGGMYGAVFHPSAGAHLRAQAGASTNDVTWADVNKHVAGPQGQITRGDLGALFGIKLFTSPYCFEGAYGPKADTNTSAYTGFVLAKDGLGASEIRGEGDARAKVLIKTPGPNTVSQPLDTYNTVAWQWSGCFKLLDSNRVIRVISDQS
jgi:N4-gp56 family major capsid protein